MRKIFIVTIFLFLFSIFAKAQQVPDYLFLEVLDSRGKPVEGATVTNNYDGIGLREAKQVTDEKGKARFVLPYDHSQGLKSYFTVTKEGYFTYHDFGGSGYRHYQSNATIELLKIPKTKKEKLALGNEQKKREFLWAAKTGDSVTLKKLLKAGISPNLATADLRGVSGSGFAFLFAVLSADSETVKTLIKAQVDIRWEIEPFRSILATYLEADPFTWHKFKTEDERKEILRLYQDGVEILLKAGADFNAKSSYTERLPIVISAHKGYPRVVQMLLDKGVSPNLTDDRYGATLLNFAIANERENKDSKIETVKLLLDAGADPNSVDRFGYGCNQLLYSAASIGDVAVIKALLEKGAKVSPSCKSTMFPLVSAIKDGKIEAAKLLIESGIHTTEDGANALMFASGFGNLELVKFLLDKGFRITDRNNEGSTALMFASNSGNLEVVKLLLENGFRVDDKDNEGKTALFYAIGDSRLEIMKLLIKAGANPNTVSGKDCITPLMRTTYSPNAVKLLVENGANINFACPDGTTALSNAVKILDFKVVKALFELGANPNGKAMDKALVYIKATFNDDRDKPRCDEMIKLIEEARRKNQNN